VTVVVDIGCFTYPDADSVAALIEAYHPSHLYGFDAHPHQLPAETRMNGTSVHLERAAVGDHEGVGYWHFLNGGPGSYVDSDTAGTTTELLDLAVFLRWLVAEHPGEPVVLKLDCEGAEMPLMEHLRATGTDWLLAEILVEFHGQDGTEKLSRSMACKVKPWWM
jgi:FkbM family methyltransferase